MEKRRDVIIYCLYCYSVSYSVKKKCLSFIFLVTVQSKVTFVQIRRRRRRRLFFFAWIEWTDMTCIYSECDVWLRLNMSYRLTGQLQFSLEWIHESDFQVFWKTLLIRDSQVFHVLYVHVIVHVNYLLQIIVVHH